MVSRPGVLSPVVIASQVEVLPLERREVGKRIAGYDLPGLADRGNRPFQVDRVPKHDGGHHQIQPTSPMPLVFVRAVPQLTQPVEEYPPLPRRLSPLLYRGRHGCVAAVRQC